MFLSMHMCLDWGSFTLDDTNSRHHKGKEGIDLLAQLKPQYGKGPHKPSLKFNKWAQKIWHRGGMKESDKSIRQV